MNTISYAMTDNAIQLEIGWRIKQKRIAKQLKQKEMAELLGVSTPTYGRAEKGDMKLGTLIGILRALNDIETLDSILPAAGISPIELLDSVPPKKQRVRSPNKHNHGQINSTLKSLMSQAAGTVKPNGNTTEGDSEW